jgi:hypothetical protein
MDTKRKSINFYKKKSDTRYYRLKRKYKILKRQKENVESQFEFFKQVYQEMLKQNDNFKIVEKACLCASRQVDDISHHIIQFSPARSFDKLKYYIVSHFCDFLKIERPYADETVQNFCNAYKSEYTDTFLKTIEASVKFFKDNKEITNDLYNMNVGDLIELLCFGNLRHMLLRHYEKHLLDKDKKEQIYTVPLFIKDITRAYESMRDGCKVMGFKKSTSTVIPPICVLDVEGLVSTLPTLSTFSSSSSSSSTPCQLRPICSISLEDQIASTYMHFISQKKLQQASIHPYQAIVSEIVIFIYTSFISDMQYMQKSSQFTMSSLSNYLGKFL